jgi:AcrR family transcriptional regulator
MERFWEHGYEGTSISDLTAAMSINAPSLYAAFGCKEQLFRESVALYEQQEGIPLPDVPSVRDAVAGLLRGGAIAYTEPDKPRGCLIVLGATTYTPATEGIRDHLAERRRAASARLRERLDRAVAEGELSPEVDTAVLTRYVVTVLSGLSTQARDGADRAELLAVTDAAMLSWEHLAGQPPARAGRSESAARG